MVGNQVHFPHYSNPSIGMGRFCGGGGVRQGGRGQHADRYGRVPGAGGSAQGQSWQASRQAGTKGRGPRRESAGAAASVPRVPGVEGCKPTVVRCACVPGQRGLVQRREQAAGRGAGTKKRKGAGTKEGSRQRGKGVQANRCAYCQGQRGLAQRK